MKQKTIMILGAGVLQLPAILKSKEMGIKVIAVDMNENSIGFKDADIALNISTNDTMEVLDSAKKYKIDGIMTLATDMPMQTVARVSTELNLPGISSDTALKATNKLEMIKALKKKKVPTPWYKSIGGVEDLLLIEKNLQFPCIVKPVDSAGSRGVVLVENRQQLQEAYGYSKSFSNSDSVIIQEFLVGREVSVETMTINGKTTILAITDKLTSGAPHFVEMGHSQDSSLSDRMKNEVAKVAVSAVEAIGIDLGPAHIEIMVTEEGPKIIELGSRMGGDYITSHLVPLSTGIDMVSTTINLLINNEVEVARFFKKGSAIRYFKIPPGTIESIEGIEHAKKISGVKNIIINKKVGEVVSSVENSKDRIGCIISQGEHAQEAIDICNKALNKIRINTIKNYK